MSISERDPAMLPFEHLHAASRGAILDALFEPSTTLHNFFVDPMGAFPSTDYLIDRVGAKLAELSNSDSSHDDVAALDEILGAHPRLGQKKVDSAQSRAEQAQLNTGSSSGADAEAEELRCLNEAYEKKFPGLIYVVFVNGRSRPIIMENMRERIARGDISKEREEAIKAMCDIARDRAAKLQMQ